MRSRNQQQSRILLIDDQWGRMDDPMFRERYGSLPFEWLLETAAEQNGVHTVAAAVARVRREIDALDAVLLDVDFGSSGNRLGVDILETLRWEFPTLPILIFTSLESEENRELVISCMDLGANEYVEKAPSAPHMQEILSVYTEPGSDHALYGNSDPIRLLRAKIARVAFSGETSVLIVGESGTGKELVARALHRQGPRKRGPFVPKNCAYSELQLLDSELYGHEKGAFTGAVSQRRGLIEEANGGVLFLDEIADMPLELQAKLLRTLETHTFRRVGGAIDLKSQFQLVCATNQLPEELIKSGKLREDFYYRIATVTLQVPTLRDRREDIPILAECFLRRFKARGGASYPGDSFAPTFLDRLRQLRWPGNARELRNTVERVVILSDSRIIDVDDASESLIAGTKLANSSTAENSSLDGRLPDNPADWPRERLLAELRHALEARRRIQSYKGNQWKAEFMRLMYPESKAISAKGFDDLIKRLTQGPWGTSRWHEDPELAQLIEELRH